ncbi:biotinidase-like [Parasteatoda tepidariorum]|uniref:biotinidase-like n=1 Tax=Parasteatoda tepidariorum TaxID=114398 RepID=UPI001C722983|nr:biotinidase-like [Parasteatoda tepidariorum]
MTIVRIAHLALLLMPSVLLCKEYFTAAVFEHQTRGSDEAVKNLQAAMGRNLKLYAKAAKIASQNGADILLFNEYGLIDDPSNQEQLGRYAEIIPDPKKQKSNPCIEDHNNRIRLSTISCLARDNNLYVVANVIEAQECDYFCHKNDVENCASECPNDGVFIYNTNVAFDREGNLIAKYRKMHPYFESVDTPEPNFVTFDTDFGKFGLIVCFDLIFRESVELVRNYNVDTLLFSTFWFDRITILNAVEFQQAWALANNVNFLAANTQLAKTGSLGSGIYSRHSGYLVYTYDSDGDSKLLLANLRIKKDAKVSHINSIIVVRENDSFLKTEETGSNFPANCFQESVGPAKSINDYRCFRPMTENFTITKLSSPSGEIKSCNNGLCCSLKYSTDGLEDEIYLAAFNGSSNVKNFHFWWEETCLLIRCDPFNGKECVIQPTTSKTVFKSLEMRAKFEAERIFPTVTKNYYRLAPKEEWTLGTIETETYLRFQSNSTTPLLKVALMGRNYKRDPPFIPFNVSRRLRLSQLTH